MRRLPCAPALVAACLTLPALARAQVAASLDMGAGTYRPDRAIPGGIASIAPALEYRAGALRVGAAGVYSDAPAGRWNAQATGYAGARSPRWGMFEAELGGQVDLTRHFGVRGSTAITGEGRLYAHPFRGTSVWFGRALGVATALDRRRPLRRSLVGTSTRVGGIELGLSISRTTFDLIPTGLPQSGEDTTRTGVDFAENESRAPSRRTAQTDALLSSRWRLAEVDVDLTLGRRFSQNAPEITIWGVYATRGISPHLAVVAGAGRSGSDPITSVPGARYVVAGLRLKLGPGTSLTPAAPASSIDRTAFRIGPAQPAGREIRVRAPRAGRVELAGDFTDWQPIDLRPGSGGSWLAVLPIAPGLHRLAIRIDRGPWHAPPGSRAVPNEFGIPVAEIVLD